MKTDRISALVEELRKARTRLDSLRSERACLNLNGHQHTISVSVGVHGGTAKSFTVAAPGGGEVSYRSVMVRGMEMVMLGIVKLYNGWISEAEDKVAELEAALRAEVAS